MRNASQSYNIVMCKDKIIINSCWVFLINERKTNINAVIERHIIQKTPEFTQN